MIKMNILLVILGILLLTIIYLIIEVNVQRIKVISLLNAFLVCGLGNILWVGFDALNINYQYSYYLFLTENANFIYHIGIDGISLFFIILTLFLLPVCILCSWTAITYKVKEFYILLYILTFLLINVFSLLDLLLFYIAFESVLIPMFLIIGVWGSRDRKVHAAYQFFLYTLFGSVFMLLSIIYIYLIVGSTHLYIITDHIYTIEEGRWLWLAFFLAFAVKIPVVPVHIWLPEAHVEAPTAGSVLLAGILLKMGGYGLIRYSISLFVEATQYYKPLVFLLSLISIIYGASATVRQIDLKKIIAYSSVVHMNYVTLGIISGNIYGVEGSIFLMLSHGLVSSALFLCIGLLYERYHTRSIFYYSGLVLTMPIFSSLFFILTLANMGLPGTSSFIGEFLIMYGIYSEGYETLAFALFGLIVGGVYVIWTYNKVVFGNGNALALKSHIDLNRREFINLMLCILWILILGLCPNLILDNLHISVYKIFNMI